MINALPVGEKVTVHVTGKVGSTTTSTSLSVNFDGVDIIRVITEEQSGTEREK